MLQVEKKKKKKKEQETSHSGEFKICTILDRILSTQLEAGSTVNSISEFLPERGLAPIHG